MKNNWLVVLLGAGIAGTLVIVLMIAVWLSVAFTTPAMPFVLTARTSYQIIVEEQPKYIQVHFFVTRETDVENDRLAARQVYDELAKQTKKPIQFLYCQELQVPAFGLPGEFDCSQILWIVR